MSEFSRYFTKLKDNRNLTSAALAEMCDMDKVIIWRWTEGRHLPEKWEKLEPVIEKLRLSLDEKNKLKEMFEYEKLGTEQSKIFHKFQEMLLTLREKRAEYFAVNKVLYENQSGGGN